MTQSRQEAERHVDESRQSSSLEAGICLGRSDGPTCKVPLRCFPYLSLELCDG